jgi:hypothetical protein
MVQTNKLECFIPRTWGGTSIIFAGKARNLPRQHYILQKPD